MTLILRGGQDTIPPHILRDSIENARTGSGRRLIVVMVGDDLPAAFADLAFDLLLDPARGNRDVLADHDGDRDPTAPPSPAEARWLRMPDHRLSAVAEPSKLGMKEVGHGRR
ncbi:MAG: hypothetical protein ABW128_14040 [Rhizorhabdus sp.]